MSHPTQYYSPWFQWLAAQSGLTLKVFYLWDAGVRARPDPGFGQPVVWDVELLAGYVHEFVENQARRPGTDRFAGLHHPSLPARLEAWRPDALLLFGYAYRTHLNVVQWARRRNVPLLFRGDSHLLGRPPPAPWKRWLLRRLFARFAAVTYVGAANRDYFRAFGVPDSRLYFAPHCVDHRRFRPAAPDDPAVDTLRRQLGLNARTAVVLFAGKWTPRKQPLALVDAYLRLPPGDHALVLVGDGELRGALEGRAAEADARGRRVRLLPLANQSEMPVRYQLATLLALPSRGPYETWGLCVNEAMHCGVPALVTDVVGCQRDLVSEGETGWVCPADQPPALVAALARALEHSARQGPALRAAVLARIQGYTYSQASEGLIAALRGRRVSSCA